MGKDQGFIMLTRGTDSIELLQDPNAFLLLTLIALRARRTNKGVNVQNLKIGECLIGDYKSCGLTEQKYKTAKKRLEEYGLATFKGTNKGTIAKLCNSTIYDINIDDDNEQTNEPTTNQQRAGQRSNNEPATTNNNVNNEKMKKMKINIMISFLVLRFSKSLTNP